MDYNINLYFVCSGTSCNDLVRSISKTKDTQLIEYIRSYQNIKHKIKKYPHLDELGVREMNVCSSNPVLKEKWKPSLIYSKVFCSLESSTIESAIALMDENFTVCPIPYMSSNTLINNEESYDYLLSMFPRDKRISDEYWKPFNLSFKISNNPSLNFKYSRKNIEWNRPLFKSTNISTILKTNLKTNNSNSTTLKSYGLYSSISTLNVGKFIEFLNYLIPQMIYEEQVDNKNIKSLIFVCTEEWIHAFFKNYNKKYTDFRFENSSVWEFNMKVNLNMSSYSIMSQLSKEKKYYISSIKLSLPDYQKIYPTPFNYEPLILDPKSIDKYKIELYKKKFKLRTSSELISITDLKNLKMSTICINETNIKKIKERIQQRIQKILNSKMNKTQKKTNSESNSESNKNISKKKGNDGIQRILQNYST